VREVGVGSEKDGGKRGGEGYGGAGMQLKGYVTVGGVMLFQMLAIPQAPKKVGAWLICPENGSQVTKIKNKNNITLFLFFICNFVAGVPGKWRSGDFGGDQIPSSDHHGICQT